MVHLRQTGFKIPSLTHFSSIKQNKLIEPERWGGLFKTGIIFQTKKLKRKKKHSILTMESGISSFIKNKQTYKQNILKCQWKQTAGKPENKSFTEWFSFQQNTVP